MATAGSDDLKHDSNDILACDWGGQPGHCCFFWRGWKDDGIAMCIRDCFCCILCEPCVAARTLAYSTGTAQHECGIINHFCAALCCPLLVGTCTRRNVRRMHQVGEQGSTGLLCDCCMYMCCPLCVSCQYGRALPRESDEWCDSLMRGHVVMMTPGGCDFLPDNIQKYPTMK